jgi:pimeloyl-ACP methyl ester carboxylesterase
VDVRNVVGGVSDKGANFARIDSVEKVGHMEEFAFVRTTRASKTAPDRAPAGSVGAEAVNVSEEETHAAGGRKRREASQLRTSEFTPSQFCCDKKAKANRPPTSPEEMLARLNIKSHPAAEDLPSAPRRCVFLFAHGAGGTRPRSECPTTMRWVRILQRLGNVVTFDYPAVDIMRYTYIHKTAAAEALARFPSYRLFLCGHSMGCRGSVNVASALATGDRLRAALAGLILFRHACISFTNECACTPPVRAPVCACVHASADRRCKCCECRWVVDTGDLSSYPLHAQNPADEEEATARVCLLSFCSRPPASSLARNFTHPLSVVCAQAAANKSVSLPANLEKQALTGR